MTPWPLSALRNTFAKVASAPSLSGAREELDHKQAAISENKECGWTALNGVEAGSGGSRRLSNLAAPTKSLLKGLRSTNDLVASRLVPDTPSEGPG